MQTGTCIGINTHTPCRYRVPVGVSLSLSSSLMPQSHGIQPPLFLHPPRPTPRGFWVCVRWLLNQEGIVSLQCGFIIERLHLCTLVTKAESKQPTRLNPWIKKSDLRLHPRLVSSGDRVWLQNAGHTNYICDDWRLSVGGENSSQPASGCVLLGHTCERSREEKRRRAAGTNLSATQIASGLSGHIGAQRAWWDMPPGVAKQARWHTDAGAGKERRKNRGQHILPLMSIYSVCRHAIMSANPN